MSATPSLWLTGRNYEDWRWFQVLLFRNLWPSLWPSGNPSSSPRPGRSVRVAHVWAGIITPSGDPYLITRPHEAPDGKGARIVDVRQRTQCGASNRIPSSSKTQRRFKQAEIRLQFGSISWPAPRSIPPPTADRRKRHSFKIGGCSRCEELSAYLRMHRADLSRSDDALAGDLFLRLYAG